MRTSSRAILGVLNFQLENFFDCTAWQQLSCNKTGRSIRSIHRQMSNVEAERWERADEWWKNIQVEKVLTCKQKKTNFEHPTRSNTNLEFWSASITAWTIRWALLSFPFKSFLPQLRPNYFFITYYLQNISTYYYSITNLRPVLLLIPPFPILPSFIKF